MASVGVLALAVGCEARATADPPLGTGDRSSTTRGPDAYGTEEKQGRPAADTGAPPEDGEPPAARPDTAAPASPESRPPSPSATADRPSTPRPPAPPPRPAAPGGPLLTQGSEGEAVREAQARLQQADVFPRNPTGYYGPVTATAATDFQRRAGLAQNGTVDDATWRALRARTQQPTREQLHPQTSLPLGTPDERCRAGRVLCISKESRTLAWMIDGRVVSAMDVRFGSQYTPTREGTFKVDFKSRDHHSTLYDTPMPFALFFSGGQAVHYSADFAATGYDGASHGCVNVRERKKLVEVFDAVRTGDKVVVHD